MLRMGGIPVAELAAALCVAPGEILSPNLVTRTGRRHPR